MLRFRRAGSGDPAYIRDVSRAMGFAGGGVRAAPATVLQSSIPHDGPFPLPDRMESRSLAHRIPVPQRLPRNRGSTPVGALISRDEKAKAEVRGMTQRGLFEGNRLHKLQFKESADTLFHSPAPRAAVGVRRDRDQW